MLILYILGVNICEAGMTTLVQRLRDMHFLGNGIRCVCESLHPTHFLHEAS